MIEKVKVTNGVYWVSVPEAGVKLLAGCPADVVKHLMRMGLAVLRETDGVLSETGPDSILLSDTTIQNGQFSNLSEFPVLQMFYRQGFIIPGHPNNTGQKPVLIGTANQVRAQLDYVNLGKYGIVDRAELEESSGSPEFAGEVLRMKTAFSFGSMPDTEDLVETRILASEPVEIRNGVTIARREMNVFEIRHGNEVAEVDLNLKPDEEYEPAVRLDFHSIKREYFAVIHVGEGDGWDPSRPCMGSVLVFQGKVYLIDCGPNVTYSLTALGIAVNEIEGIFHTHVHDDHFAGLPSLVRTDHRVKYFATPLVRRSVMRKLSKLMGIPETRFQNYFDIVDLEFDRWNPVDGLEVMPIFSPHPVETNAFYFRTYWEGGYRSYAHLADITALDVLERMVTQEPSAPGVSAEMFRKTREAYKIEATVKKIDGGGGMIHGDVRDFKKDPSRKILIAHKSTRLTDEEKEIGSNAAFGAQDVLIPASQDYAMRAAARHLASYYPSVPNSDLQMLLNCGIEYHNVGVNIVRRGESVLFVHLLLQGSVELIDSGRGIHNTLSSGSFLGDYAGLTGEPCEYTYRASSYARTLKIPSELYGRFINRNFDFLEVMKFHENMKFLMTSRLFGDSISSGILSSIARSVKTLRFEAGARLETKVPGLFLIRRGEVSLTVADMKIGVIGPGDICGEETVLLKSHGTTQAVAERETIAAFIRGKDIESIPVIEWKLLETYEKRIMAFGGGA